MDCNHPRKFCPGCKINRSAAQYRSADARFCNRCVTRGMDKKPESAKTAGVTYAVTKSIQ